MSFRIYLEIIRAIIAVILLCILMIKGKPLAVSRRNGYKLILIGFALITFASILDITDNFPSLDRFVILGDTAYQAILEKVVGYLGGFLFITVGFWKWLPGVHELQSTQYQLEAALKNEAHLRTTLQNEKKQLITTLNSIGDGVISTDSDGNVVMINPVAAKMTGWSQEEAVGKKITDVFKIVKEGSDIQVETPVKKVLEYGEIVELANHIELISKNGERVSIADSGAPVKDSDGMAIGVVLVFRDASNERKLFDEKLKLQRLESIGVLAGGIAHDFNNLLMGIQGNISLALASGNLDNNMKDLLGDAEKAADRATRLTKQLLTFSKGGDPNIQKVEVEKIIRETAKFILTGSNVNCTFDVDEKLWLAKVDKGQFSQVIENLIINARQAMPNGGTVEISLKHALKEDCQSLKLSGDKYLVICVKDNGEGIEEEAINKIFDPYFSTKRDGSGLGLATSFSIIQKHDGILKVKSEPGKGSTFIIYIPAGEPDSDVTVPMLDNKKDERTFSGRILIMDDEPLIRKLLASMLRKLGYNVLSAADGKELLKIYKENLKLGEKIDLVMLDLTIPGGMGGEEVAETLLKLNKDVKMIVVSGYAESPVISRYREYGFSAALPKPFSADDLGEVIRKVLQ